MDIRERQRPLRDRYTDDPAPRSSDVPCSGDLLLGAPAACQAVTLRVVAVNMGIEITAFDIDVDAEITVEGAA